ncbi:MAG: hypothetical protein IPJ13_30120 [Saprospiraceae bacterium]|nr:hypothetical protein [Saprospiraceae bacterium]
MKTKNFIFSIMIFLAASMSVQAQKIALVDINDVLSALPEYQNAQTELDKIAAIWAGDCAGI